MKTKRVIFPLLFALFTLFSCKSVFADNTDPVQPKNSVVSIHFADHQAILQFIESAQEDNGIPSEGIPFEPNERKGKGNDKEDDKEDDREDDNIISFTIHNSPAESYFEINNNSIPIVSSNITYKKLPLFILFHSWKHFLA